MNLALPPTAGAPSLPASRGVAGVLTTGLPGWPIAAVLWGMPLWWVLGLTPFISFLAFTVMGLLLVGSHRVVLMPGTLPLLALVGWTLACAVMLDSTLQLVGFGFRWAMIAAAVVVLVYVTNSRVTEGALLGGVAVIGALVVVGGWLGLLVPHGGFVTPMARVMPAALWDNELVRDLLAPSFAEVQQPWGADEPFLRPSAPFPYTNGWGCAIALLVPSLMAFRERCASFWMRAAVWGGLAATIPPAIATRNRGMLLILGVIVVAQLIGLAWGGKARSFTMLASVTTLGVAAFVAIGGWERIQERQALSDTTAGRASIYSKTWETVLNSPVLGFGAPRPSPEIGISLGTQGAWWTLLFSYGFVGVGLFLAFLVRVLWTTRAAAYSGTRTDGLWLHSLLVGALVAGFFYGFDNIHFLLIMVASAILLRRRAAADTASLRLP